MEAKGLTGLTNLGNTCFINTTIQILSYIDELHNLKADTSTLLHEWHELRKLMFTENCTVRPAKFIHCIQEFAKSKDIEQFAELEQNDMTEFFLFLIDCFHGTLSRPVKLVNKGFCRTKTAKLCFAMIKETFAKEYSEIYDIFYGIHLSQIKSIDGKVVYATKPEYFRILDLPITTNTLSGCLDSYMQGDILQDDNQWYNEKLDKKMDVHKSFLFWKLPKILVFAFKRFRDGIHKNQSLVDFPLNDFVLNADGETDEVIYDLFGVVNHFGVMLGGHYTAFLKNQNQKWYEYNDTIVQEMPCERVVTPRAYCLFYRKRAL
jgi:hypothetical protein